MTTTHFLTYPPNLLETVDDLQSRDVLVFFISGNPGLIDFYKPFLSTLKGLLDETLALRSTRFQIYGQDLAGFRADDHEPFTTQRKPFDLEHQIQHTLKSLSRLRVESGPRKGLRYHQVLLIGHSVGAYIALELFHRHLQKKELTSLNLTSGILLFPTIHHISSSPTGWKLDLLRRIPVLGDNAYRIAQGFLRLVPRRTLHWIVNRVIGSSGHGVEITTNWLKSRDGVWQALHMGMDEMKIIGENHWDDELWEIAHDAKEQDRLTPKFFFFFGKHDHWVANHHRDEFIKTRQEQGKQTRLIVDEGDIPHAFCIRHNEVVASKVSLWISELYGKS